MFGMMQKGGIGGPPSSAEIAKLQQQHSAIVAENKKIIKELKQLEAAVSSDQSGAAIARLDKQLEKLSSAHKEIAGKQERGSAEHDKVVAQLNELRKELGKQGKELSKELSKQIEVVKGDLAKAKKEMVGSPKTALAPPTLALILSPQTLFMSFCFIHARPRQGVQRPMTLHSFAPLQIIERGGDPVSCLGVSEHGRAEQVAPVNAGRRRCAAAQ
jgi:molybdopterin converting factor small subunit